MKIHGFLGLQNFIWCLRMLYNISYFTQLLGGGEDWFNELFVRGCGIANIIRN